VCFVAFGFCLFLLLARALAFAAPSGNPALLQSCTNCVKDWDQKLQAKARKIMLIVDHAPTHMVQGVTPEQGLKVFPLSNIMVTLLPPNVTAKSQPCGHGIIECFKAHYRRYLVQWLLKQTSQATKTFS
jgi:hypothetical protein